MSIIAQSNDGHHARFVLRVTGASGLKQPTLPMDPEHRPFVVCEAEWASDRDCGTRIGGEERPTPGAACATATPKGGGDDRLALALYPTLGAAQEMRNRLATCLIGPSAAPSNTSPCGAANGSPPARQPSTGPGKGPAARAAQWIKDAPTTRTRSLTATPTTTASHTTAAGSVYTHWHIDAGA
ncbi:hypothetical protein COCC4DRAFT_60739 [Bipolaris maydis ATCC 48331]|uniref:Uncharacterized protein n=1 Tax=Cochliobolus heterostrophus (strain C4 / ATCC 48331 / race T) TaxID=665024 RepID=N4XAV9_COCH4|nr:uncharacterized protein COCC4DRAFT_60739 [Bipolaris maydis ATCC 48331]ENI05653.1 hypothetical protein COCC4DRAFT_60739 [Bipolaris maydis ATCC 48331]